MKHSNYAVASVGAPASDAVDKGGVELGAITVFFSRAIVEALFGHKLMVGSSVPPA